MSLSFAPFSPFFRGPSFWAWVSRGGAGGAPRKLHLGLVLGGPVCFFLHNTTSPRAVVLVEANHQYLIHFVLCRTKQTGPPPRPRLSPARTPKSGSRRHRCGWPIHKGGDSLKPTKVPDDHIQIQHFLVAVRQWPLWNAQINSQGHHEVCAETKLPGPSPDEINGYY